MFEHTDVAPLTWNHAGTIPRETLIALVEAAQQGDEHAWSQLHATAREGPIGAATSTPRDPLAAIVDSETCRLLRSLLDELGQRDRKLIRTLIEGHTSYRRIAELLEMPIGSIGPTRQRIIARLHRRACTLDIAA